MKSTRLYPAILLAALAQSCGSSEAHERYNLVLVSLDTLRPDHLSAYGYERETSAEIQAFAEANVLFENAFSHSPKTAPSHMSMMTGLIPDAHGVRNFEEEDNYALSESIPTIATILSGRGWRTAAYTSGGHVRPLLGFGRGFEEYDTKGMAQGIFEKGIKKAKELSGEPFFLFIHTYEIHDPYVPPPKYRKEYANEEYAGKIIGGRKELTAAAGQDWSKQARIFWDQVDKESEADVQELQDLYDSSIHYCDEWFGKLLQELDDMGELERTLVILVSDHGESFGERGEFLHESVHQELLHVPLVIHLPAALRPAGTGVRISDQVQLVDLLPTVMETLDIPLPEITQGRSLLALVREEDWDERPIVSSWPRQNLHALRDGRWKLIWREAGGEFEESVELFDLENDPGELVDLAQKEPDVTERMLTALQRQRGAAKGIHALQSGGEAVAMDDELMKELRALGYVDAHDDASAEPAGSPLPDENR